MSVASVFDFGFGPAQTEEGYKLASGIGADMPAKAGYLGHDVIRDNAPDWAGGMVAPATHPKRRG